MRTIIKQTTLLRTNKGDNLPIFSNYPACRNDFKTIIITSHTSLPLSFDKTNIFSTKCNFLSVCSKPPVFNLCYLLRLLVDAVKV